MKVLFVSGLYPSSVEPQKAPYNRRLMLALYQSLPPTLMELRRTSRHGAGHTETLVIAPVEWFPGRRFLRGRTLPPFEETLDGIDVAHPRVFYTPGTFIHKHWLMYRRSIRGYFKAVVERFRPDHIIIAFAYPDGAAVAPLCRELGVPYSLMVLGSDFRIRTQQEKFRHIVMSTLKDAPLIFCPGKALKRDMAEAGIDERKIVSFDNGVDTNIFHYREKSEAFESLKSRISYLVSRNCKNSLVLYVGNLVAVKGVDLLLTAFASLLSGLKFETSGFRSQVSRALRSSQCEEGSLSLAIIGDGPLRRRLERQARRLDIAGSVCFLGSWPHDEIALWMNAADCLCLPSRSEGMPNVVIEALASGLPVVATDVGECREMLAEEPAARIISRRERGGRREIDELARAMGDILEMNIDRKAMAERHKNRYSWNAAAAAILGRIEPKTAK